MARRMTVRVPPGLQGRVTALTRAVRQEIRLLPYVDELVAWPEECGKSSSIDLLKELVRGVTVSEGRYGPFAALSGVLRPADPRDPMLRETPQCRGR